jgi:protein transport protein SEC61 subunit alpha
LFFISYLFLFLLFSSIFLGLSTISNFVGTGIIILIISYFRNCHFNVPIHKKTLTPGGGGIIQYPVKLLYTGNMPIILFISSVNNVFIISQNMSEKYKKVGLVKLLGVWKSAGENSGMCFALHYYKKSLMLPSIFHFCV